ncbi:TonB-dependent receptor [Lysobacteraceae bacterium NML95-0200]|nr:TonB-dependent receptor [Xanthomonadaceae bacterium NML95-0200]
MLHRHPLAAAVLAGLLSPSLVFAQAADTQTAANEQNSAALDKITVTGTRIARDGFVTPSPVTGITSEEIRATGATNIGELMVSMPQLTPSYTMGNTGGGNIGTSGLSLMDLRGMGASRTLVLVNGRRHVGANEGSSSVDVNTIPVEWIDRVEVITGGASAVYGADAVAGVVNFILKKDFEGFRLRTQAGKTQEGGHGKQLASITAGTGFADGRGNVSASLEFSRLTRLDATDRAIGRRYLVSMPNPAYDPGKPADERNPQTVLQGPGGTYVFSTAGTFLAGGKRYLFNPDGSVRLANMGRVAGNVCVDCDFIDLNQFTEMQPDYRRFSVNTQVNFEISDNHRLFFEGKYVEAKSRTLGQPTFGATTVARDNAFVSPSLAALMDANGMQSLTFIRANADAGRRGQKIARSTRRFVLGLEGSLNENWDYEVSANYGQTDIRNILFNNRVESRWRAGLDAVRDANGQIVCRSGLPGCVPFNVFGDGTISAQAADWFNVHSPDTTRLTQAVFSASVNTPVLFALPAGDAGFAAGVEYRKEKSRRQIDPLVASGATFMNALAGSNGQYSVKEVFAELSIPLLADKPLIERFAVDLAGRYSRYSTAGKTKTWNIGLDWALNSQFRVRSSYAQAVRAPNIAELFAPQSQDFRQVSDPCNYAANNSNRPQTAADAARRQANCSALGIPVGWEDTYGASRPGVAGGNPALLPETARSLSAGFVWQPEFINGLGLSVDYWRVNLNQVIGTVSAQTNATRCVDAPGGINNKFCGFIRRAPAGGHTDSLGNFFPEHSIYYWEALNENLARRRRAGIDVEVDYRFDLGAGKFISRFVGTRMLQSREWAFQEFPHEYREWLTHVSTPRWRGNLDLKYLQGGFRASWTVNYVHHNLRVEPASYQSNPGQASPIRNGSHVVHNTQFGYQFQNGMDVSLGVNNVFNKNPPVNYYGTGVGSALYESLGRYAYLGLNYTF